MIQLGTLTISNEDLAVIAHVVHNETPEDWATRAFAHLGETSVLGKIERHRTSYLAAKDTLGYQTASERMIERRNNANADLAAMRTKHAQDTVARIAKLNALSLDPATKQFIRDELL